MNGGSAYYSHLALNLWNPALRMQSTNAAAKVQKSIIGQGVRESVRVKKVYVRPGGDTVIDVNEEAG